jgi:serine/threonine protein kinase
MGIVFLARDPLGIAATDPSSNSGFVAIKTPFPELVTHPRSRERFLTEARHLQQFDHPNILRVLEIQNSPTHPYLVMPHLKRGSLAQYLHQQGPLPTADTLRLASQIASALLYAHKHGIIHRDLKPANVLLTDRGDAVLTDFGLARTVFNDSVVDITSEHREGTAPYMSPAVARGEAEDTRCDIYSFGAVLYEMLTGSPPYSGLSAEDITRKILTSPPTPIRKLNPTAPQHLTQIAECAMAREWRHRYAHMVDIVADLQRVEAGLNPTGPHGLHTDPPRKTRQIPRIPTPVSLLLATLSCFALGATLISQLTTTSPTQNPPSITNPISPDHESTSPTPPFLLQGQTLLLLQPTPSKQLKPSHQIALPWMPASNDSASVIIDSLSDINGDGQPELLLRTSPQPNTPYTTIACIDVHSGQVLWTRQHPGGFLPPAITENEIASQRAILVASQEHPSQPGQLSLLSINGSELKLSSYLPPQNPPATTTPTPPKSLTLQVNPSGNTSTSAPSP